HHRRLGGARVAEVAREVTPIRVPPGVRDRHDPHATRRVLADAARAADVCAVRGGALLLLAVLAGQVTRTPVSLTAVTRVACNQRVRSAARADHLTWML